MAKHQKPMAGKRHGSKGNGPSRKGGKAPWSAGIPRALRGGTRK